VQPDASGRSITHPATASALRKAYSDPVRLRPNSSNAYARPRHPNAEHDPRGSHPIRRHACSLHVPRSISRSIAPCSTRARRIPPLLDAHRHRSALTTLLRALRPSSNRLPCTTPYKLPVMFNYVTLRNQASSASCTISGASIAINDTGTNCPGITPPVSPFRDKWTCHHRLPVVRIVTAPYHGAVRPHPRTCRSIVGRPPFSSRQHLLLCQCH
jgi:hypothetical protein